MQVPCPRCRALLILPEAVIGRPLCCPNCRTVFDAEAAARTSPVAPTSPPAPAVPEPAARAPGESDFEPTRPPPAPRAMLALRQLTRAARWIHGAAAFDFLVVLAGAALLRLADLDGNPARRPPWTLLRETAGLAACLLCVFGPLCGLFWASAGRLAAVRLNGLVPVGLVTGLGAVLLLAGWSLLELAQAAESVPLQRNPWPAFLASFVTGTAALLTLFAWTRAVLARREAIRTALSERLADYADDRPADDERLGPAIELPVPRRGGPLHRARTSARGLRAAAIVLTGWYALSCTLLAGTNRPWFAADPCVSFAAWLIGLPLLGTMAVGAQHLARLEHRGWALAGSAAAFILGVGFGIDFCRALVQLADRFQPEPLLTLAHTAVALAVAVSCLFAAIGTWQTASDPGVRREFRR